MAKAASSKLENTIFRKAVSWAGQITRLAKSFAPNHLRSTIRSRVEKKKNGAVTIIVSATAPDARAQEFGSGLHARRGPKKTYEIRPKKGKKFLAFNWEVANANPDAFTFLEDGRVLLPLVNHPGIEATNNGKGYLAPAINEVRKRGRANLTKELRIAILSDIRTAFRGAKK